MSDSYYPKHSRSHLDVIREWPVPSHDVPRLTREVEGLREENEKLRVLLREASVWMLADSKLNKGYAERVLALKTRIDLLLAGGHVDE